MTDSLRSLLLREAARINSPEFIEADPVQFPRRFSAQADVEIVALLAAHLAWGNRTLIRRDVERLLSMMDNQPSAWVRDQAYEAVADDQNIHRTFFGRNLKHLLRGLHRVYSRYGTLDEFCRQSGAPQCECSSWVLAEALNHEMAQANSGESDSRCLPLNLRTTALKRLNMALRWLVRCDGIVDMGVWRSLTPAQLYVPLDVHVGRTALTLGLTDRTTADRRTAVELTQVLRTVCPDDPVLLDFALFGLGVSHAPILPSDC